MLLQNPGYLLLRHGGDIGDEGKVEPFNVGVEDGFDFPFDLSFFDALLNAYFNAFFAGSGCNKVLGSHNVVLYDHC